MGYRLLRLIPLSLQHVVAAVVGIITPAIIIAGVCNLAPADKTLLIQVSLVMSGLVTIFAGISTLRQVWCRVTDNYGYKFCLRTYLASYWRC